MKDIITLLITSGALGFWNVLFLERIGALVFDTKLNNDKFMWSVIFAAINYGTYVYFKNIWITIGISLVVTVFFASFDYKVENFIRKWLGKSPASDKHAWDIFWESAGVQPLVFVLDVVTNEVIDYGYLFAVTRSVDATHEISLNIPAELDTYRDITYEELQKDAISWKSTPNQDAFVYIDASRKYLVFATI